VNGIIKVKQYYKQIVQQFDRHMSDLDLCVYVLVYVCVYVWISVYVSDKFNAT